MAQIKSKKKRKIQTNKDIPKSFSQHIKELKTRFYIVFIVFIIFSLIGFGIRDILIKILLFPSSYSVFFTSPSGGLNFSISISIIFGLILTIPILIFHTIKFLSPLLTDKSKYSIFSIIFSSFVLLTLGLLFAYFISIPALLQFLNKFSTDQLNSLITANEYLSFILIYLLGFGFLFQLPLLMLIINSIYKLTFRSMMKFEKWVLLLSFLIGAILTPTPDIFNQMIIAIPLIILYQISVIIIIIKNRFFSNN